MLFINSKIIPKLKHKLHGWDVWGNLRTMNEIDRGLILLYCRIFSVHQNKKDLNDWKKLPMDVIETKSKEVTKLLNLNLTDQILD